MGNKYSYYFYSTRDRGPASEVSQGKKKKNRLDITKDSMHL